MAYIHVIHENQEWSAPLFAELRARNLPYRDWFLHEGVLDLSQPPPDGVFYNRMSASAHTRRHRYAPEYTGAVLAWLESHGRRVINGVNTLRLEVSKAAQYAALNAQGIATPRTRVAVGKAAIVEAARDFDAPFITKHNRAGKGLGVRLFDDIAGLADYVDGPEFEPPVDGITLIQQYIRAPEPFITRVEFVGDRFLYAVRVDTSDGFELCPADVCDTDARVRPTFEIVEGFDSPLLPAYRRFLDANDIGIAGIEFITDADGRAYTYDVNSNTNYNSDAEAVAGLSGMAAIADHLGRELTALTAPRLAAAGD